MLDLEAQGVEKERALRQLEETVGQNQETYMTHLSTSEPDLSAKGTKSASFSTKRKNNPRWWWVRPRRLPHKRSHAPHATKVGVEMAECPERVHVFTELLSIISERNKLVTQEAIIMAELKKIELEAYEETLQLAYDSVQRPSAEAHQQGKSKKMPFRLPRATRSRKPRVCSATREPTEECREEQLRDEIWRVSKERVALTVVQGETIERKDSKDLWL
uniref:BMERB domain-containing protein n=1 Tax=Mesocestoides corti TaxID=53468 RepID=A0A5K3FG03_MESCO